MYRIIFIIVITLAVALGLLLGTLNSESVSVDLLWLQIQWPLGLLILTAVAAGLLAGMFLSWFFSVLPLRAQLRKLRNQDQSSHSRSLKDTNV